MAQIIMEYPILIFFGLAPSAAWLLFYLRKDVHPESNRMILKVFFFGMIVALPVVLAEMGITGEINKLNLPHLLISVLSIFLGVALVEELIKYLVVREKVLEHHEFDEPIDAVLYMIIAALGFAASENILIIFSLGPKFLLGDVFSISIFRFLGATFLHGLASGIMGYFLALSIYETGKRTRLLFVGIVTATLLHGLYNLSIIEIGGKSGFIIPVIVLLGSTVFLTYGFKKLKKLKSICKIH